MVLNNKEQLLSGDSYNLQQTWHRLFTHIKGTGLLYLDQNVLLYEHTEKKCEIFIQHLQRVKNDYLRHVITKSLVMLIYTISELLLFTTLILISSLDVYFMNLQMIAFIERFVLFKMTCKVYSVFPSKGNRKFQRTLDSANL